MWAIGGDVHAKTTTFYALDDDGNPVDDFNRRFVRVRSDREGFSCVCRHLAGVDYQILVENSTKTHDVVWMMEGLCMNVIVAHTPDLKKIAKSNSKTDKNDAKDLAMYLLARFAGAEQFGTSYMCSKEDMMDRQLCRMAKQEMIEMGKTKKRIRSHALMYGIGLPKSITTMRSKDYLASFDDPVFDDLVESLNDSEKRKKRLEKKIETRFKGNPTYERMMEIPYFGTITAAYLTSYISDIGRFRDSKAFVASLGLVPRVRNSSEKISRCGITKTGDPHARWLLIQATIGHVRNCNDSPVTRFFNRKNGGSLEERRENGEDVILNRSAIVVAAAKMARTIYTLEVKDRHW